MRLLQGERVQYLKLGRKRNLNATSDQDEEDGDDPGHDEVDRDHRLDRACRRHLGLISI
jgi:hypothetical protein